MTTKPKLKLGSHLVRGVGAVALFVVMVATFLNGSFGEPAGFGSDASVTAAIGQAMFNLDPVIASESFLVVFEIIDLVLVAALVGAVLLARREEGGRFTEAFADGGRDVVEVLRGGDDE
jgi:NADH-quinone oxidoreductase subunit J